MGLSALGQVQDTSIAGAIAGIYNEKAHGYNKTEANPPRFLDGPPVSTSPGHHILSLLRRNDMKNRGP